MLCSAAVQRRAMRNPVVLVAVLPIAAGLVETLRRAWVCDDVFISFRYVDHLLRGQGLVFNPGERVEGYTHFLWVILLAACNRLGFDLVALGRYLPILFFAATLVVLAQRAWRLRAGAWMGLPIAASGLATGFGFIALVLVSVNIFGGFLVTQRMLAMYKKKEK